MQRNKRYDADLFLRERSAAMFVRRIRAAELLGEIAPAQNSTCVEARGPSSGEFPPCDLNSGRCEGTISPAASARLCGEGK